MYYCCCAAKTANKQGHIHASYQVPEMEFFEYYEYIFPTDISGILGGLNLAHAWRHRLFEAWLVSGWFEVNLVGDVTIFLPALSQYNLNRFFLAQILSIV